MSLLIGSMRKHLEGHKELTDHTDVVEIRPKEKVYIPLFHGNCTNIEVLVKEGDKVKVGTKVAIRKDKLTVPLFSSVSGTVSGIKKNMHDSLRQIDHLVIDNDGKYVVEPSFAPLDYQKATREELIEFMMNAGIVGLGGAGFPAYFKYQCAKDVETLLINGVECEPYITADYRTMCDHLDDLIVGCLAMQKMACAKNVLIAIKESKADLIAALKNVIAPYPSIEIVKVPDVYPMGWERTLIYQVFKKRYDRLPGEVGVVVNNATTAIAFAQALLKGEAYVEKIVTVSGDGIKRPANVKVRIGTPVFEIVDALGGYTADEVLVISGGPMMGKTVTSDQFVITPYANAITILKDRPYREIACLRCGRCSEFCPAALQPVRINQFEKAKDVEQLEKSCAMDCIECGLCTYVCPSRIDVTEGVRRAKRLLAASNKK